jgi:hypothetical protein
MPVRWRRFDFCDAYTICEFCSLFFRIKENMGDLDMGKMMQQGIWSILTSYLAVSEKDMSKTIIRTSVVTLVFGCTGLIQSVTPRPFMPTEIKLGSSLF